MAFGMGFGWVGPALAHLSSDDNAFDISDEELSWVASMYFATEVLSSIAAGMFSSRIGRKPLISFGTFLLASSWLVMIFAHTPQVVVLSRAILGAAAGIFDITWSIYLGEITSPRERGIFGSVMITLVIGGEMLEFLLSLYVPHVYLSVIPFIIASVSFVMSWFMVEAPQFLITQKRDNEAQKNLAWLRGEYNVKNVQREFDEVKEHIEEEKQNQRSIMHFFKSPSEYKVYIICVVIFSLAQLTGNIIILSYQTIILEKYDGIPPGKELTLVYGIVQFAFVNLNTCFIETVGRRPLLLAGFLAATIIQTMNTYLIYAEEYNTTDLSFIPVMVLILFNIYGVVFIVCILPTIFVLKSELFPQELKAIGSVSATVCNAIAEFIVTKLFILIWNTYGLYINFCLYALIGLISTIYVYALIPETKGKSLVEIQKDISAYTIKSNVEEDAL